MDSLIKHFDAVEDADLMLCLARGLAYQKDPSAGRVQYDEAYYEKVWSYERTDIARAVNIGRCELIGRHIKKAASILDIGSGSGAFLRAALNANFQACGFEVMPEAVDRLRAIGRYEERPGRFDAVTFWDSIEHMEDPEIIFRKIMKGAHVFASIPVFRDLTRIRESKHYRPGEHLYYWTPAGFIAWMGAHGFRFLEESDHEVRAGREQIGAFAFAKDLPDYHDHVAAYQEIHSTRHYGSSSTELHLAAVTEVVRRRAPASIIDYGCGRSDLAAHFWLDGARQIMRYYPAIPGFATQPTGPFDLALCCDVMEHIPVASVDRILAEVSSLAPVALFTISTKPARAKLPDGRNAHVTLLTRSEWTRWVGDYFGAVEEIPTKWEHEVMLLAGAKAEAAIVAPIAPCECGGEAQLEVFDHPRRDREFFMRCRSCQGMGPSAPSMDAARALWTGQVTPADEGVVAVGGAR